MFFTFSFYFMCVQDLDNETLLHIDAENRRQALEDELEFLKQVHEQVIKHASNLPMYMMISKDNV